MEPLRIAQQPHRDRSSGLNSSTLKDAQHTPHTNSIKVTSTSSPLDYQATSTSFKSKSSPYGTETGTGHIASSQGPELSPPPALYWMASGDESRHTPVNTRSGGNHMSSRMTTAGEGYDLLSGIASKLRATHTPDTKETRGRVWTPDILDETETRRRAALLRKRTPDASSANSSSMSSSRYVHRQAHTPPDGISMNTTREARHAATLSYPAGEYSGDLSSREIAALTALNNELSDTIETLRASAEASESKAHAHSLVLENSIQRLENRCQELQQENGMYHDENERLKVQLRETQLLLQDKEGRALSKQESLLDIQTYMHLVETLTRENSHLTAELDGLRKNLSSEDSADKKSQKSLKLLLDSIKFLEVEKEKCQQLYEEQKGVCEELQAEREGLLEKLKEVIRRYKRTDMELRELQSRVQEEVREEVEAETSRLYELQEERDHLAKELHRVQQECRLQAVENMRLDSDKEELKEQVRSLSQERQQELIESLRAQVESLSQELAEKDSSLLDTSSKVARSLSEVERDKARISELQSRIDRQEADKNELEIRYHNMQEDSKFKLKKANSELSNAVSNLSIYVCG